MIHLPLQSTVQNTIGKSAQSGEGVCGTPGMAGKDLLKSVLSNCTAVPEHPRDRNLDGTGRLTAFAIEVTNPPWGCRCWLSVDRFACAI